MSRSIAVQGAAGRMGIQIMSVLIERGHIVAAAFEHKNSSHLGKKISSLLPNVAMKTSEDICFEVLSKEKLSTCDGIIDFSAPQATLEILDYAVELRKPIVIGTTGFDEQQVNKIKTASERIPILFSPNMSVGVNVLFKLTELAAKALGEGYDIEIFEAHHRHKKDAPSGTAKKLFEIIKSSSPQMAHLRSIEGRSGNIGARGNDEVGMMVLRGGDIVGEHTVFFVGEGERIELTHRAMNRKNFAIGAVLAMEYILQQSSGLYSMFDVLGF